MQKRWFTIAEASAYFSIKSKTLYSLIGRGLIREDAILRLGRAIRINIEKVESEGIKNK